MRLSEDTILLSVDVGKANLIRLALLEISTFLDHGQ